MSRRRQDLGRDGEELAAKHLLGKGYRILARRYRTRYGEIDLVAEHRDTLVFVEVKMRSGAGFGPPQEAVHPGKQARIARAAASFLQQRAMEQATGPVCRFDVVAVLRGPEGAPVVEHIEDAFRPTGV